jgi:hypothetical protein
MRCFALLVVTLLVAGLCLVNATGLVGVDATVATGDALSQSNADSASAANDAEPYAKTIAKHFESMASLSNDDGVAFTTVEASARAAMHLLPSALPPVPAFKTCRDAAAAFATLYPLQVFSGHYAFDVGLYGECSSTPNAHYCTANYELLIGAGMRLQTGMCIPAVCNAADVRERWPQLVATPWNAVATSKMTTNIDVTCVDQLPSPWESAAFCAVVIIVSLLALAVAIGSCVVVRESTCATRITTSDAPIERSRSATQKLSQTQQKSTSEPLKTFEEAAKRLTKSGANGDNDDDGDEKTRDDAETLHYIKLGDSIDGGSINTSGDRTGGGNSYFDALGDVDSRMHGCSSTDAASNGVNGDRVDSKIGNGDGVGDGGEEELPGRTPFWRRFCHAFALQSSWRALMSPQRAHAHLNLHFANVLRVFAMVWIILGHTLYFTLISGLDNAAFVIDVVARRPSFQLIQGSVLAVDVFFVLSGFFAAMHLLRVYRRYPTVRWSSTLRYAVRRIARVLPLLAAWMAVYTSTARYLGDGPFQASMMHSDEWRRCDQNWWAPLLFINNFYPRGFDRNCVGFVLPSVNHHALYSLHCFHSILAKYV